MIARAVNLMNPPRALRHDTVPPAGGRSAEDITARLVWACQGVKGAYLSRVTRTHEETTRRYMRGTTEASPAFIAGVIEVLCLSPDWLLFGIGSPYREDADQSGSPTEYRSAKEAVHAALQELTRRVEMLK